MNRIAILFSLCVFVMGCGDRHDNGWDRLNEQIKEKYPEVEHITTSELNDLMKKEEVVIIDVREKDEYEVSHIRGAVNIMDPSSVTIPENKKIICYCSVGYRSAEFAGKLRKAGYNRVYNLKGSLFEWANKGYDLYTDGKKTQYVHPYNEEWGRFLKKERHRYHKQQVSPHIS